MGCAKEFSKREVTSNFDQSNFIRMRQVKVKDWARLKTEEEAY